MLLGRFGEGVTLACRTQVPRLCVSLASLLALDLESGLDSRVSVLRATGMPAEVTRDGAFHATSEAELDAGAFRETVHVVLYRRRAASPRLPRGL